MVNQAFQRLAARVHAARTPAELSFIFCNETRALAEYRQAALVAYGERRRTRLAAHSGLADVDANSPYALWLADVVRHVRPRLDEGESPVKVMALAPAMLPAELAASWTDWLPAHVWLLSLAGPDGVSRAALLLARDTPWPTQLEPATPEYQLLGAADLYGYAWWSLTERRPRWSRVLPAVSGARLLRWGLPLLALAMLIPVRDYALVQAEIVSNRSQVIASPRDGVIRRMVVPPNTPVEAGQVIAELDDTTLYNQLVVAKAALSTAQVELHQASQRAIESQTAKADLGLAEGKLRERQVDVEALGREIEQLSIRAPARGVFVYSDPDDWAGRPVQTGQRVGLLADPQALGLHAWAPVGEAVNLKPGAPMTLFLRVAPLHPALARLDYAGYEAVESPGGVASYLLRGTITGGDPAYLRIGLRGTARIVGDWTVLGYLLLRRPMAALREWFGW
ncbi:hypothetical protein GCM10023144_08390 [Pigmentiphaga soli]|uniref:HlyD family efflux transporter periplasmic adaptor subunit n=1 Tax=Pigmentiphaga soli TaxID=1007095 RepID=A0ABP8GKH1_9BURK